MAGRRLGVGVSLGRAGVHQGAGAPAQNRLDGFRILGVVEIAQDDEFFIRVGGEVRVNPGAEEFGLLESQVRLVGFRDGEPGLEMALINVKDSCSFTLRSTSMKPRLTRQRRPASRKKSLVCGRRAVMGNRLRRAIWMLVSEPVTSSQWGKSRPVVLSAPCKSRRALVPPISSSARTSGFMARMISQTLARASGGLMGRAALVVSM